MQLLEQRPTVPEYIALRSRLGWGQLDAAQAQTTLDASSWCACMRDGERLAGLVRFVGDGVLYLVLADLMVHPDDRGQGLGERLMGAAVDHIERVAHPFATVTVVPLPGREDFYERFGFERCPNHVFGAGMAYLRHLPAPLRGPG